MIKDITSDISCLLKPCISNFEKQFEHCHSKNISQSDYSEYHSCLSLICRDYNKCVIAYNTQKKILEREREIYIKRYGLFCI